MAKATSTIDLNVRYRVTQGHRSFKVFVLLDDALDRMDELEKDAPVVVEQSDDRGRTWRLLMARGSQPAAARRAKGAAA